MSLRSENGRLYQIWLNMRYRCNAVTHKHYEDYGGRGITYCKEWEEFEPFYEWAIHNGYEDNLTLDRINNDGNYEPSNCRWITIEEQQKNRRYNHDIWVDGIKTSLQDVCKMFGINYYTVLSRINTYGYSICEALITPVSKRGRRKSAQ